MALHLSLFVTQINPRFRSSLHLFEQLSIEGSTTAVELSYHVAQRSTFHNVVGPSFWYHCPSYWYRRRKQDPNLLRNLLLSLIPSPRHLFATVELHDAFLVPLLASSRKGFVKLLKSRPDIVNYIHKVTYKVSRNDDDDHLLSAILLLNFRSTFSRLNCLIITASQFDWNTLDSSLTSAFLQLMHLPTINHIDLSHVDNFPLSSLTPSVNLHRLDIFYLRHFDRPEENGSPEVVVQLEMMPKIREFYTSKSSLLTTKLLYAKTQGGSPRLSTSWILDDSRYLPSNPKMNWIFDIYYRMPSYLKNSIYQPSLVGL